ncbi:MAG: L,D-transpeptidase [Lachnospiraceae bacterium]|nr:L,D-transpeptidase [Lachnospiraceae bacterium]
MLKDFRKKEYLSKIALFFAAFAAVFSLTVQAKADTVQTKADITVERSKGVCNYTVDGIDIDATPSMTLKVSYEDEKGDSIVNLSKEITFDKSNCTDGSFSGSFSMTDMESYTYAKYKVSFIMSDGTEINADKTCDFSVHKDKYSIVVSGKSDESNRNIGLKSTESSSDVIVPGENNKVKLVIWKKGSEEPSTDKNATPKAIKNLSVTWDLAVSSKCASYGTYYAKVVLENENLPNGTYDMGTKSFSVSASCSKITVSKSADLEKKVSFKVVANNVKSALGVSRVSFSIFNSAGKKVYTQSAKKISGSSNYYAVISFKKLNYNLDKYTIKVNIADKLDNKKTLSISKEVDQRAKGGTMSIKKGKNYSCKFILKNAYIPGKIKNVRFSVYIVNNGKKKFVKRYYGVYNSSSKAYTADMPYTKAGKFVVYAYGVSSWGKVIYLNKKEITVKKSELGKNGWYYEKYDGKTYKRYYKNNVLVKDLTKILGIKKNASNLYIEINRAACVVNIYAYDSKKKKYIIPVKTCTVSVGRDVKSNSSAASLNISSSFTPIGTYSICSNGTASKYSVKPMHEPNGSTVYARWTSHIVGNVYFHSIAVGSNSHYALRAKDYNKLGSPASAGCVRMTVADAKWIYDHAAVGTKVKISVGKSSKPGPLGKNKAIKISSSIKYDPTDSYISDAQKKKDYKAKRISGYITKSGKKVGC